MRIILDSCFILNCIKNKIDILSLEEKGKICIPEEVLEEIKTISGDKRQKVKDRENADLTLQIINSLKEKIEFFKLGNRVDDGLFLIAKNNKNPKNQEIVIATTDKELKRKIKPFSRIISIKGRYKSEFV